jgi:hypothetical protein
MIPALGILRVADNLPEALGKTLRGGLTPNEHIL